MTGRITFKDSPFYKIQKQLSNVVELKPREQTRDTARLTVNLDEALATRFQADSSCRAMVFCAAESFDSAWKPVEIAFPHHAEIRCNQDELKVNLKGLKNKPGSTRPVDITPFLRKKAGFPNNVELVYALTNKVRLPLFLYTLQMCDSDLTYAFCMLTGCQSTEVSPSRKFGTEEVHRYPRRRSETRKVSKQSPSHSGE